MVAPLDSMLVVAEVPTQLLLERGLEQGQRQRLEQPAGPVSATPQSRAAGTSRGSRTAASSSSDGVTVLFAASFGGLTSTRVPTDPGLSRVPVIIKPFSLTPSARWASYPVRRILPSQDARDAVASCGPWIGTGLNRTENG